MAKTLPTPSESAPSEAASDGGAMAALRASNVRTAYVFTLVAGVARGVWSYAVLSGYLYVLTDRSNFRVGLAEGAQGISQAVVSIAAGVAADAFRRDVVCRVAAVLGITASAGLVAGIAWPGLDDRRRFAAVTASLALFGAYQGVWNTALETLFADSTHRGERRTAATTRKFGLTLLATTAGPLIAIGLFLALGDHWSLYQLRTVMACGLVLCAPPALLLTRLRDVRDGARTSSASTVGEERPSVAASFDDDVLLHTPPKRRLGRIPYVVLASDVVSGFGSGMTVKFVPLFFKNRVGFTPMATNALYVVSPLLMLGGSRFCAFLSRRALGRARCCAWFMAVPSRGRVPRHFNIPPSGKQRVLCTFQPM